MNPDKANNKHEQDNTGNDPSDTSIGHEYDRPVPGETNSGESHKNQDENEDKNPRKDVETLKQEDSSQTNKNDLIPPAQA